MGYTSDPQAEEHAILFDQDGNVKKAYSGKGWDGQGYAEGPGDIVRGISGEAVRILKRPGELSFSYLFLDTFLMSPCRCRCY